MLGAEFPKWNFQIAPSRGSERSSKEKTQILSEAIQEQRELFVLLRGGAK